MRNLFYFFSVSFLKNQLANKIFAFLTLLFLLLPQYSCNTTEPLIPPEEQPPKAIKLKLLDISCTEAFIKVTAADTVLPVNIILKKDNVSLFSFTLTKTDTTVIDTTLQPNITYTYQTTAQIKGKEENSDTIQVKTLNTTSHNFTWQTFTFGGIGGSSALYDVAIIDENNIWAVGEIYADTTGLPYNAVHWDGSSWELERISVEYHGYQITPPLYGIFTFSATDIWLSAGVPIHGDGKNWTQYHLFDMGVLSQNDGPVNKILGSSSSDIYFVGYLGTIAHYQNGVWSKVESGTTTNLNDIWGHYDHSSNEKTVLCVASNILHQGEYRLLTLSGNSAHDTLNWTYNDYWLKTIWFNKKYSPIYIGGGGIKVFKLNQWEEQDITNDFIQCIRGSDINDIFASGDNGFLGHFNGIQWHIYNELYSETVFLRLAAKGNTVVIVGYTFSGLLVGQAIVVIGRRIP